MPKKLTLLLILSWVYSVSYAQDKISDSLYQMVKTTRSDSIKVRALNKLAFGKIFGNAVAAKQLLEQAEKIASGKPNCRIGYAEMLNYRGVYYDVQSKGDSAVYYFTKALKVSQKNHFASVEVRCLNNLGMAFWNIGNNNEALHYFLASLKINESLLPPDQMKFDTSYSNIGLIYQELKLNVKALEYHLKAYEIRLQKGMTMEQAISLNNIGICYNAMGETAKAIATYQKGMAIAKAAEDQVDYLKLLSNLGNALQSQNKYREAIQCYEQVLAAAADLPKTKINTYGSIVSAYNHLNQPEKGITYGMQGIEMLAKHPDLENSAQHLYQYIAQSYYKLGNIEKGEAYNSKFLETTTRMFSAENAGKIANYEIKYETAQKEKQLAENHIKLIESELSAQQKNNIILGISVLAVFAILIVLLLFRQQNFKRKQLEQEHLLKTAIAQIETQNQLQQQRLAISRDLHDNIGAQLTFIISSVENIKYGFDVKNSKLGDKLENISSFAQSTIVELRDTIWAMNNEIHFEDLRARILNFIEKAKEATGQIDFNFMIGDSLSALNLTSLAGMNLYRSIQESVNNAIKYAHASQISIAVQDDGNGIIVEIKDNGMGFDILEIERGNGLSNMQKRIEAIGGVFTISSLPQHGTTIKISVPFKNIVI